MSRLVLCWIGLHAWVYATFHMDVRECRRCKRFEEFYAEKWHKAKGEA